GVGGERLAGAHAEELGVEVGDVLDEPAPGDVGGAGGVGAGVGQAVQVPAAVGGERGDGLLLRFEHLPQVFGAAHAAGQAAGHGDDGDRLVVLVLALAEPPVGPLQVGGGASEVVAELVVVGHAVPPHDWVPSSLSRIPNSSSSLSGSNSGASSAWASVHRRSRARSRAVTRAASSPGTAARADSSRSTSSRTSCAGSWRVSGESSDRRCSASMRGVGWSKTRVDGSRSPVAALSRLRRSTPVS